MPVIISPVGGLNIAFAEAYFRSWSSKAKEFPLLVCICDIICQTDSILILENIEINRGWCYSAGTNLYSAGFLYIALETRLYLSVV